MSEKREDRRVLRTRNLICHALFELIEKKPISQITVTELCEKADINRNTFYCHYQTPNEVLNELAGRLKDLIADGLRIDGDTSETIAVACRIMKENRDLCRIVFSKNAELDVYNDILQLSSQRNRKKMQQKENPLSPAYQNILDSFTVTGASAAIQTWVNSGMKESPEDIADFISALCYHGSEPLSTDPDKRFR